MGTYADWSGLVEHYTREAAGVHERLVSGADGLADESGFTFISAFIAADQSLAVLVAAVGPDAVREVAKAYHGLLERAAASLEAEELHEDRTAQSVANLAVIAECLGLARPPGVTGALLEPLVGVRHEFDDPTRRSLAFTALALREPDVARALLDAEVAAFDLPVARMEFNQYGLIGYLAAAIEERRPAAWVEPLWAEYLELFPWHLAADAAMWPDLFCFGRVVADLRGDDGSTVAAEIHDRLQALAGRR